MSKSHRDIKQFHVVEELSFVDRMCHFNLLDCFEETLIDQRIESNRFLVG